MTPLHFAARTGQVEIVKVLLDLNSSLCAIDTNGHNALELAMENKHRFSDLYTIFFALKRITLGEIFLCLKI